MTETLADRCSYLVSDKIKDRKAVKKKFKELYGVRSKIVHGVVTELSSEQVEYLDWGKFILEYAITKEIQHIDLESE